MSAFDLMTAFAAGSTPNSRAAQPTGQPQQFTPSGNPTVPGGTGTGNPGANGDPKGLVNTPANPNAPGQESSPADPLAGFAKLWENVGAGNKEEPLFNTTREDLQKAFKGKNFAGQIPQEVLTAIEGGGPNATKAMIALMNNTTRNAQMESVQVTQKLIEAAITKMSAGTEAKMQETFRKANLRDGLISKNPALNNPAVAPLVGIIQQQMAAQFPEATQAELLEKAQEYFTAAAGAMNPNANPNSDSSGKPSKSDPDWGNFFQ